MDILAFDEARIETRQAKGKLFIVPGIDDDVDSVGRAQRKSHGFSLHPPNILLVGVTVCPEILNLRTLHEDDSGAVFDEEMQNGLICLLCIVGEQAYVKKTKGSGGEQRGPGTAFPTKFVPVTISGLTYRYILLGEGGVLDMLEAYCMGVEKKERVKLFKIPCKGGKPDVAEIRTRLERQKTMRAESPCYIDSFKRLQEDSAGGHGFSRHGFSAEHNEIETDLNNAGIKLFQQPVHSPCLNPLDIGIWASLKARVDDDSSQIPIATQGNAGKVEAELWKVTQKAMLNVPARVFFSCWQQRQANMRAIISAGGDDFGAPPHHGIRKKYKIKCE